MRAPAVPHLFDLGDRYNIVPLGILVLISRALSRQATYSGASYCETACHDLRSLPRQQIHAADSAGSSLSPCFLGASIHVSRLYGRWPDSRASIGVFRDSDGGDPEPDVSMMVSLLSVLMAASSP